MWGRKCDHTRRNRGNCRGNTKASAKKSPNTDVQRTAKGIAMPEADKAAPLPGTMPNRLPENAPAPDFDPKAVAKGLLRMTRAGALATIDRNTGHPFASLVNVATDADGSPIILVSRLSTHTANLEADGRASLLLASAG